MVIEAVLLTGGASRRMGADKASLSVDGEASGTRIQRLMEEAGIRVTVLGPGGKPDAEPHAGPLAALAGFEPTGDLVFLASCDLPRFDARLPGVLASMLGEAPAAVPIWQGREQPLCALYRPETLARARELAAAGKRALMSLLEGCQTVQVTGEMLLEAGLDPRCVAGANTPDEWAALLAD